jgi:hypothetical protein
MNVAGRACKSASSKFNYVIPCWSSKLPLSKKVVEFRVFGLFAF